ncbi:Uncharacterized protein APZ42_017106 [Daphnia magna]|uniref:Uncharacterized protein n=1 Tax=Daphnia magna TaxID=35525 RepID=A0A0P6C1Q6_9CRUS|nr:Uncharacterized protein APZ42_017106 [Daphnia magna]
MESKRPLITETRPDESSTCRYPNGRSCKPARSCLVLGSSLEFYFLSFLLLRPLLLPFAFFTSSSFASAFSRGHWYSILV